MALIPWWISYPNVNDEIMNLDWLLRVSNENTDKISNFINLNTIKYADPILWNITSQYEANTVVVDGQTGNAYISIKAVPSGVQLNRTEYWTQIYNYADVVDTLREQIAYNEEESTTATRAYSVNNLVFVNGELYRVTHNMVAGDSFVVGSNVVKTTIDNELGRLRTDIDDEVTARTNADNTINNRIDYEENQRQQADNTINNRIDYEENQRQQADTNLQNNINNIRAGIHKVVLVTDSYGAVNNYLFPARLAQLLGSGNLTYAAASGQSFSNGGLLTALQGISVSEPDDITDVVICGGVNDAVSPNYSNIYNGVSDINTYAKTTYPNARISFAFLGRYLSTATNPDRRPLTNMCTVINAIKSACTELQATYIVNSEYCLWKKSLIDSDGLHPSTNGSLELAYRLYEAITTGYRMNVYGYSLGDGVVTCTDVNDAFNLMDVSTTNTLINDIIVDNNETQFFTMPFEIQFNTSKSWSFVAGFYAPLFTVDSEILPSYFNVGTNYKAFETITNVTFKVGNTFVERAMKVGFYNNNFYIGGYAINDDETGWLSLSNITNIYVNRACFKINTIYI